MGLGFGIEMPSAHVPVPHRRPVRYLVLINAGGSLLARLFLANREPAQTLDAAATEVSAMTAGLRPQLGALGPEWDLALQSHSVLERSAAEVFTLLP